MQYITNTDIAFIVRDYEQSKYASAFNYLCKVQLDTDPASAEFVYSMIQIWSRRHPEATIRQRCSAVLLMRTPLATVK